MYRSPSLSGAFALAACIAGLFLTVSTSAGAADVMPDPRILSAAPFEFRSDAGIFARLTREPTDARIFFPHELMRRISRGGTPSDGFAAVTGA